MKLAPLIALGSAFVLTTALVASVQGGEVTASCGTASTPLAQRGIQVVQSAGGAVHSLAEGGPSSDEVTEHTLGMWATVGLWWDAFGAAARGDEPPEKVAEVTTAATTAQVAALSSAGCTPTACQGLGGSSLAGADLAADALRKAGFPASEIPTFVAIANLESSFNPKAWNDYGAGMAGMFQLNQAYWKLDNWQDPYANAVMAKKVRDESVARGDSPWYPWSTWRAAVRDAGKYAEFGTANITDSSKVPSVECDGQFDARIATWNSAAWNSTSRVVQGFHSLANDADVIAGQELPSEARRAAVLRGMPEGWAMFPKLPGAGTNRSTSVPILVNTNKLTVVAQGRVKAITRKVHVEHGSDGNTTGPKYVTWVTVRDADGDTFSVVNTHLVVSASPSKPKRQKWWTHQRNVAVEKAQELSASGPVAITCDCNKQSNPFAGSGFADSSSALGSTLKTHTNRTLDYVATAGAEPASQALSGPWGSDHHALVVTFKNTAPVPDAATPAEFDKQGNPRTVEQAIAFLKANPNGAPGETVLGHCERYMNLAYGLGGGYGSAIAHWNAAGPKQTSGTPPRGALVFFGTTATNPYGHVALSVGGGRVISTDFDGTGWAPGKISEGPIEAVNFGTLLGWRVPNFNVNGEAD